jgi:hypothetical protein
LKASQLPSKAGTYFAAYPAQASPGMGWQKSGPSTSSGGRRKPVVRNTTSADCKKLLQSIKFFTVKHDFYLSNNWQGKRFIIQ